MYVNFFTVLIPLLVVWYYSLSMMVVSNRLINGIYPRFGELPLSIKNSLGFFFGITAFLSIWRLSIFVLGAATSLYIITALVTFLFVREISKNGLKIRPGYILLAIIIHLFVFAFWANSKVVDPYSTVGSGHAPRYGNISLFIHQFDRVPMVGQGYGQSLLGSIGSFFGLNMPLYFLDLWLAAALFFLVIFTYAVISSVINSKFYASIATFFIFFTNISWTRKHVMVTDFGWPLITNGYSDSIISIGTLIITLLATRIFLQENLTRRMKIAYAVMLGLIGYFWTMSAVQNIYIFGCCSIVFAFLYNKNLLNRKLPLLFAVVVFALAILAGRYSGGMLTPVEYQEEVPFGGMIKVAGNLVSEIKVQFGLTGVRGSYSGWQQIEQKDHTTYQIICQTFKYGAFAFLGLGFGIILSMRRGTGYFDRKTLIVMLTVFLAGLSIVLPFTMGGIKWGISRFLVPGYYFILIVFIVSLYQFLKAKPWLRLLTIPLIIFGCWGPISDINFRFLQFNFPTHQIAMDNINAVFSFNKMIK